MLNRIVLAAVGSVHIAHGLTMIAAPAFWYNTVPGVANTGPANLHFIPDIGFAFLLSGMGLLAGLARGERTGALALAGAAWPLFHALFHVWGWLTGHLPSDGSAFATELIGVIGLSVLGASAVLARHAGIGVRA